MRISKQVVGFALASSILSAATTWPTATPEQAGFDQAKLEAFAQSLPIHNTRALLIARHGKLVFEWYASGVTADQPQGTASLAKALVGGMSLLAALDSGRMKVDDPASKYIPEWRSDPRKRLITIRQLATHSSGIDDAEADGLPHDRLTGWKGDFWKRKPDPISIAIHEAPVVFTPGARFQYSNPGMAALGYAITASMRGTTTPDLLAILRDRLYRPLGIPDEDWQIGYGESYSVDGLKVYADWGGARFTPRATARIGQFMLQKGQWNGKQLVGADWIKRMTSYAGTAIPDRTSEPAHLAAGLAWWTNFDGAFKSVPRDAFMGAGAKQQMLMVVPSLDLVIVRNGDALSPDDKQYWTAEEEFIFGPIVESLRSGSGAAPYPPSPVIARVEFGAVDQIVRKAIESDNWPMTWGDDDALYTSYGDGMGFEPFVDHKLSMGIAKILGTPPTVEGINVRSESGERTGNGQNGPKASGMLMVDGVLYMLVRNTGNAQLVWSRDHGAHWTWDFKFEESFGSPSFLNFGKNYAGARDDFVYIYSQDGPSAYEASDSILLARVPKNRVREKSAYEYFVSVNAEGTAKWSRDLADRGAVFQFPGHCQRVDAVYDAGLRRYLLAVSYSHGGAWGIYDAPTPWGPWTTAFHTLDWGLGGTHGYRFTSKWFSPDGRAGWLVFSGIKLPTVTYDAFCLRRMTLVLR